LGVSPERNDLFLKLSQKELSEEHASIYHCIPTAYPKDDKSKVKIGFTVYETIDPPKEWIHEMNKMDLIITPSHFNKNVFVTGGLKTKCEVVPHCFNPALFNDEVRCNGRYNKFTFLSMGTFRKRKNFDLLINAFYDGFTNKDNVCLLIKTDKGKQMGHLVNSIKADNYKSKDTAPIYVDDEILDFEDIPSFMKKADVFVSPSAGEGFCLPSMHALALNIPIIVTKYGGALEYAKPEFSTYFIPYGYTKKPVLDGFPQFANKIWPDIKVSEVRDKMLFAYHSLSALQKITRDGYQFVHDHFNYKIIGHRFVNVVEETINAHIS